MKKTLHMFIAALVALLGLAATPAAFAATPTFDEPIDRPARLIVTLPAGNPYDDISPAPLDGYKVGVSRVQGVDVSTPAGYASASEVSFEEVTSTAVVGEKVTGADGVVIFEGLEAGLYAVEADVPAGRAGAPELNPILVVLPGVFEDGSWAYGVSLTLKHATPEEPTPPSDIPSPEPTPPPTPNDPLASTGVSVKALAGVAAVGLLLGFFMLRWRERA
ncbi:MAG: hypothetical protein Q4E01_05580 [Actinomycetaceae bacterium]|nr:hypothetical protein [Actinomycetaceae bacterium]